MAVVRERLEAHREWVDWRTEGGAWGGGEVGETETVKRGGGVEKR